MGDLEFLDPASEQGPGSPADGDKCFNCGKQSHLNLFDGDNRSICIDCLRLEHVEGGDAGPAVDPAIGPVSEAAPCEDNGGGSGSGTSECYECKCHKPSAECSLVDGLFNVCSDCLTAAEAASAKALELKRQKSREANARSRAKRKAKAASSQPSFVVGEHGSQVKIAKKTYKCAHDRQRSLCRDCKGVSICEHDKVRSRCKDCKGAYICEHNRVRGQCKDCKGASICDHGRRRSQCKECGGSSVCDHGRRRSQCKECGGSSICDHGRRRSQCKECGGSSICDHGRNKYQCKECGGSSICTHGKRKGNCNDCRPNKKAKASSHPSDGAASSQPLGPV